MVDVIPPTRTKKSGPSREQLHPDVAAALDEIDILLAELAHGSALLDRDTVVDRILDTRLHLVPAR